LDRSELLSRPQQRRLVDDPEAVDDPFIEMGSTFFTHLKTVTTGWRCRSTGL